MPAPIAGCQSVLGTGCVWVCGRVSVGEVGEGECDPEGKGHRRTLPQGPGPGE